jgi:hypothetical protein
MALFNDVFNKSGVYGMLFFNVKAVLIHPTLEDLKAKNPKMYERWKYLSKIKHGFDVDVYHGTAGAMLDETPQYAQKTYAENAVNHPEFCRIAAITYGTLYNEGGEIKRYLKKIVNEDECVVIDDFMDLLSVLSSEGSKSSPPRFHILCGHNIIAHDIPLLIKRFMVNRKNLKSNKELPYILKKALDTKPWESGIIDTVNVWKFNGFDYSPLMLIADFLGLKKTDDLVTHNELSQYYWTNVGEKPVETLEYVARQSAIQTNLVIQLMLELRLV